MSLRHLFDEAGWRLLREAPVRVATSVMITAPSGLLGVVREVTALRHGILDPAAREGGTGLVAELVADLASAPARQEMREAQETQEGQSPTVPQRGPVEQDAAAIEDRGIDHARDAVRLVREKAGDDAARDYAQWLVGIAVRVALAAREDTRFGFGGTRVSEAERAIVRRLAWALGVPAPAWDEETP